jgi:REP element-mobilizing transposase RayT
MHAQTRSDPEQSIGVETAEQNADTPSAGQAHFLTISTLFRRPLFLDPDAARAVARMQSEASIWAPSRCLAWVLMPDRWQGLIVLGESDSLDRLVRRFKAISARAVEPRFRINGWLWAKGFNERPLTNEESLLAVARHIVANPVRSGLAKSVGAYPYWNAVWLDGKRDQAWARA